MSTEGRGEEMKEEGTKNRGKKITANYTEDGNENEKSNINFLDRFDSRTDKLFAWSGKKWNSLCETKQR